MRATVIRFMSTLSLRWSKYRLAFHAVSTLSFHVCSKTFFCHVTSLVTLTFANLILQLFLQISQINHHLLVVISGSWETSSWAYTIQCLILGMNASALPKQPKIVYAFQMLTHLTIFRCHRCGVHFHEFVETKQFSHRSEFSCHSGLLSETIAPHFEDSFHVFLGV